MEIGIGTVQFGLDYGISNREGKTAAEEVVRILDIAVRNGIRIIDTAARYGLSEEVLGASLPINHSFSIVTKTPSFSKAHITTGDMKLLEDTFHQSLMKLKQVSVYGLLIHHADNLLSENGRLLMEKMLELKQRRLVKKIGVSVYTAEQADRILDRFAIDLIQVPINVLDQRLIVSGHLAKFKTAGVEVHARSVFLQGLLVMNPEDLPSYFDPLRKHLKKYHDTLYRYDITPIQAALGFLMKTQEVDFVICGVNNHQQLSELCAAAIHVNSIDFNSFAISDESMLNPSVWRV